MKKKTDAVESLRADIKREIAHWIALNEYGGQDPSWPDGVNMNLTRNHVIYDKRQLKEICEDRKIDLPEEYFLPTPPQVDDGYMATLKQKRRVAMLRSMGNELTTKKVAYDENQLSLF